VVARDPAQQTALHAALTQLAEQDPLIAARQDDERHQLFVSLFGEVQKEVLEQTLATDFGIAVDFHATSVLCVERPAGPGSAVRRLGEEGNPYQATIGLTLEPGPAGSGIEVRVTADLLSIPMYVYKTTDAFGAAVTGYVRAALGRGPAGWPVHDCVVTLTECGYSAPGTRSRDVRKLSRLVVADALRDAGTVVCEPVDRFELEGPAASLPGVLQLLGRHGAAPDAPVVAADWFTLAGELPAAEVQAVQQQLSGRTHGEGVLEVRFARYAPARSRATPRAVGAR
jgi:ribosomal protection tetracycline resistance protein